MTNLFAIIGVLAVLLILVIIGGTIWDKIEEKRLEEKRRNIEVGRKEKLNEVHNDLMNLYSRGKIDPTSYDTILIYLNRRDGS